MNTRLRYELENAIQKWADDNCEGGDWPNGFMYDNEIMDMTAAAELVFDASIKGQDYYIREGLPCDAN